VIQRMVVDYYVTELHAASCFADVDVDLLDELKGRSRAKHVQNKPSLGLAPTYRRYAERETGESA
jgi:hypothetical protein